jgi:hypothetical protein
LPIHEIRPILVAHLAWPREIVAFWCYGTVFAGARKGVLEKQVVSALSSTIVAAAGSVRAFVRFLLYRSCYQRGTWTAAGKVCPLAVRPRWRRKNNPRRSAGGEAPLTKVEAEDLLDWLEANELPPGQIEITPEGDFRVSPRPERPLS